MIFLATFKTSLPHPKSIDNYTWLNIKREKQGEGVVLVRKSGYNSYI